PGKVLIVDTQWITTPTDVDTWVFGAAPGVFAASDPAFFGPAHVELVGGSTDTRTSGGTFTFETATGGPREVVAAGLRDGLGFIALHSVLFAGTDFTEPFTGAAYVVETFPTTVTLNATGVVSQPFTHTWTHTFSTTRDISEGITVTVGGSNLIVNGIPPGPILAGTPITFTVTISEAFVPGTAWQGSLLIGPRFAPNALNVPITLRMLDPAAPLTGTLTAAPASVVTGEPATFNLSLSNLSTATETVTVTIPIPVLLAFVPGSENASTGALVYDEDSATLVWSGDLGGGETLSLAYDAQGGAGQGLVQTVASIAALSGQTFALRADVTVNPAATLAASREWLRAGETVTFTLIAPNTYTGTDAVTVTIPIPSLLEMAIGSPTASTGELFYDVVARQLSWNGDLGAGETLTLTYRSTAQSGYGTADTLAAISSLAGSLTTTVSASVFVNPNFGAAVAPGVAAQTGDPGSTVTYTLLVTNTGDTAEAFDVGVSGNLWGTAAPSTAGPLPAGTGAPLTITAAIPPGAMGGVTDRAAITIRSQSDPTQTITAALTTTVNAVYAVELSPGAALGAGHPGETITYTLQITNTGNTTDSFDSAVVTSTWGVALPPTVEALPPGWSATLAVSVTIPITATDSVTGTAIIAVISQGDASVSSRTTLTMQAVWRKVWLPMVRR
ncbi:MAG: hypothetical protein ACE5GO_05975, partial [Anaerolineales bacterium]